MPAPDHSEPCELIATDDKFDEAHYFLSQMFHEFHEPQAFRWNLNAFLQALRSVTLMIQSELKGRERFGPWWTAWQTRLRADPLMVRFVEGRNVTVHKGLLNRHSQVKAALFADLRLKMAIEYPLKVDTPTSLLLERAAKHLDGLLITKEHPRVGEQLGIVRTWIIEELSPDEEVVMVGDRALSRISKVVASAHEFLGLRRQPLQEDTHAHAVSRIKTLLETDLDPLLPLKRGWVTGPEHEEEEAHDEPD